MDNVRLSSARDLHDSTKLASVQRDLCHPNRESRQHGYSQLHSGIFRHIHSGCRRRRDSCRWEWLLGTAILLRRLLLSLPRDVLWRLLRGLWLSLSDSFLWLSHGGLWVETNCLWAVRVGSKEGWVQPVHRALCARRIRFACVRQS